MTRYQTSFIRIAQVAMIATFAVIAVGFLASRAASAHCDGLHGPVVTAAPKALETGDVNQVLIWVRPQDDDEIKKDLRKRLPSAS